jgi:polyisoprenoid-binding protein YceI
MTTTPTTEVLVPRRTWAVDPVHSNANFEIEHSGVSVFRGGFEPVDAKLVSSEDGITLEGAVKVDTITIDDPNIRPHVLSPDFFDAERNPEITFRSTEITGTAGDLMVRGDLALAGVTLPVTARGRVRGPVEGPTGEKLALSLEATIDRTAYGMTWQMEMPNGGPILGHEVKLIVELELAHEEA